MEPRFTEHERRAAVEHARRLMVEDGYSQNKAAEAAGDDLGVKGRTVMRWAESLDLPLGELSRDAAKTRAATAAHTHYDQERRLGLNNLLFDRIKEVAGKTEDAGDLKDLAMAFGILTDKRRLEEGKSTERHEHLDQAAALERGRARLSLLPAQRA